MIHDVVVLGSGTAGLITSLMLRAAFPNWRITIVSSGEIGIIGVGEGSTEHWRMFMRHCDIPVAELLTETAGTHKMGIRYKDWTTHTPDYFHSVSSSDPLNNFGLHGLYCGIHERGKLLTNSMATRGLVSGKLPAGDPHSSVNQFHFDTFKLNQYLTSKCISRNIRLVDAEVADVVVDPEDGYVTSLKMKDGLDIAGDFFIDASGFKRVISSAVGNTDWESYAKYLPMNSAIAFPTPSSEDGTIHAFTWARALKNGWNWEIPTQERRGNGYVFCDAYETVDQAVKSISDAYGFEVQPAKTIKFDPGFLKEQWRKNVIAVGLASSFVEPLEATSIGSTIQQARCMILSLASFRRGDKKVQQEYNRTLGIMAENLMSMVFLHYMSDRRDSEMWLAQAEIEAPPYLQNLLELWAERPPTEFDIGENDFQMFLAPHFWHVAQGQGVIPVDRSAQVIRSLGIEERANSAIWDMKKNQSDHYLVDHRESLRLLSL
jgi:tryptophan halogenase